MQGIPPDSSDLVFVITALYAMFGIPITAMALGSISNHLISPIEEVRQYDLINAKFDKDELKLLECLGMDDGDNSFTKYEFVLFSLIRGNKVEVDLVKSKFSFS